MWWEIQVLLNGGGSEMLEECVNYITVNNYHKSTNEEDVEGMHR